MLVQKMEKTITNESKEVSPIKEETTSVSFRQKIETFCQDVNRIIESNTSDQATFDSIKSLFKAFKEDKKTFDKNSASKKSKKVRIKIEKNKSKKNKIKNKKSKK